MANIISPLRYPGGKSGLSPYLEHIISENGLSGCCYIEPFAGGAGAALNLLFTGIVSKIVINDFDHAIAAFWRSILHDTENFLRLLHDTPINIAQWMKWKQIFLAHQNYDDLSLGFATFFLNRTNRSGVLSANPIGGLKQTGNWKIDARFNKVDLSRRILAIARKSNQIIIREENATNLLKEVKSWPKTIFVYLDPPYYEKGSELYLNHFKHEDHDELAYILTEDATYSWLATYDDHEHIRWLYRHCKIINYTLFYYVSNCKTGSEVCITDSNLQIPSHKPKICYNTAHQSFFSEQHN